MSPDPSLESGALPAPLRQIREEEVVATWLMWEERSPGPLGEHIAAFIVANPAAGRLIREPDIENEGANAIRASLLGKLRGWGTNDFIFVGFPASVRWYEVKFSHAHLSGLRYMGGGGMDFWDGLAGEGRFVGIAAQRVINGLAPEADAGELARLRDIAEITNAGVPPSPLIVVSPSLTASHWVVIEGTHRVTGYCMANRPPEAFPAFLGVSQGVNTWPRW